MEKLKNYRPTEKEPFMNERQRDYFRAKQFAMGQRFNRERVISALAQRGLPSDETAVFMDEVDVNLNPKVGCMWMHRGVLPQALLGHSIGEYAAACIAGVFSLDSALEIVAERGALIASGPHLDPSNTR